VYRIKRSDETFDVEERLPLLPLRDVVIFPFMTIPLFVGRTASVNAIEEAVARDRLLFAVAQRRPDISEPAREDLYRVGTVVRVLQLFRLPDGTMRVLVEGIARMQAKRIQISPEITSALVVPLEDAVPSSPEAEALMRTVLSQFNDYVRLNRRVSEDVLMTANNLNEPSSLSFTVAAHVVLKVSQKQELLEAPDASERLRLLGRTLAAELEIVKLERKIEGQVRSQVSKNQKEFYLNEQLKAIRKELGHQNEFASELEELEAQVRTAKMPKPVHEKAMKELDRLGKMSYMSPEATVSRNYIDWLVSLPWSRRTRDRHDMKEVERILEEDHHGLAKVKERILEYIAVIKLSGEVKGPILCLVGPPGVGKTSLGRSIARALGRKFVRMSLGGVRDEAEIRGHRRTYIGSLPGRIVQAMRRAGSRNPVLLLDEVDKLGTDYRGDPSAALLEVLDPEQNHSFNDHYLEVDFDLSQVLFVTTANVLQSIPPPLQDRMEVIRLPGYLEYDKIEIARRFLIPKQVAANGLKPEDVRIGRAALLEIIRSYTREAGVRNLEREIAHLCRKVARRKATAPLKAPVVVSPSGVARFLGAPRFQEDEVEKKNRVGVATGLAWTETGGEILTVEVSVLPGRGKLLLTGKLGEIMRESAKAALSYARSRSEPLGLDKWFYKNIDLHVHIPEGAMPKDGPSAGITMAVALISALTGVPTRDDVAMTGEITLRGNVLPVGGLNEKLVAAHRAGLRTVIVPKKNAKSLQEVPREVREGLSIQLVESMDETLEFALGGPLGQTGDAASGSEGPRPEEDGGAVYTH
jgi:ATP-dependent Lon protease